MKTGILLINLGTPSSPQVKDVRRYLREFLSDPYVIDINLIVRWLLLNLIILPTRPRRSARAYRSIWTKQGSPLLVNSQRLADKLQTLLGDDYCLALGMRYGNPSITTAINQLKHCDALLIFPLFPQYSLAATQTAIKRAKAIAAKLWVDNNIKIIRDFYDHPSFINTQAKIIGDNLSNHQVDKILFSYHGLPKRHIQKTCQAIKICDTEQACPNITTLNKHCYKAQCFATSKALARALNLNKNQYITTFQSRLGVTSWIKPYTDKTLVRLASGGIKNIAISCPSFVVDCLETLEEIGIRARKDWHCLGGRHLYLIPCLNDNASWAYELIRQHINFGKLLP